MDEPLVMKKLTETAGQIDSVSQVDAVLLIMTAVDNLDTQGRAFVGNAKAILTTPESAAVLGGNAIGLKTWETFEIDAASGRKLQITATPARHGPAGSEAMSGTVTGFLLNWKGESEDAVYISGDTVWFEGVAEIATRFDVGTAILFLGAVGLHKQARCVSQWTQAKRFKPHERLNPNNHTSALRRLGAFSRNREKRLRKLCGSRKTKTFTWLELGVETSLNK